MKKPTHKKPPMSKRYVMVQTGAPRDATTEMLDFRMRVCVDTLTAVAAKKGRVIVLPSVVTYERKTPFGDVQGVVRAMTAPRPGWKRERSGGSQ